MANQVSPPSADRFSIEYAGNYVIIVDATQPDCHIGPFDSWTKAERELAELSADATRVSKWLM